MCWFAHTIWLHSVTVILTNKYSPYKHVECNLLTIILLRLCKPEPDHTKPPPQPRVVEVSRLAAELRGEKPAAAERSALPGRVY